MLHVLRHYFPIRKALLMGGETVLLTLVLFVGMSSHLWKVTPRVAHILADVGGGQAMSFSEGRWRCLISSVLIAILAQVAIAFNELYDIRISGSRTDRARRFVGSAGVALVLALGAMTLADLWGFERVLDFPGLPLSQKVVVLTFSLSLAFILLYPWRTLFHFALQRLSINERVLLIGHGPVARTLAEELRRRPGAGYEVVALLSDMPAAENRGRRADDRTDFDGRTALAEVPQEEPPDRVTLLQGAQLDQLLADKRLPEGEVLEQSLPELVRRLDIDYVVVGMKQRRGSLPVNELLRCRLQGVAVEEGEVLYERITGKIAVGALRPSYLIFNQGFVQHPLAALGKRLLDLVLSFLVLALTWPLMVLTGIAVKLDTPGPMFFRQERVGRHRAPFTLIKFRSMRADAEKLTGPVWASEDDPRITRVGKFIRKTRLDELPQLLNVLAGEMSMVGPRPEREHFVRDLAEQIPFYEQRHLVKPGLTGWAQINYPYGNTVEDARQKLMYDLFYIKNQSLIFDLSILFNTIKTVVLRQGT